MKIQKTVIDNIIKNLVYILLVSIAIISKSFADNSQITSPVITDSIVVTSPNGGENWQAGSTQDITWTSDISGNLQIRLYKDGFLHSEITPSTPNDSSFTWSILTGTEISSVYKIRIESIDDPTNFDFSDNDFTISSPDVEVTSPNGGEMWQAGETHVITWNNTFIEQVKIELYKNGSFHFEITDNTPSDGEFIWDIPYDEQGGSDYKIKILRFDFTTIFDFSDSNFTIVANEVTVTSPMPGDTFHAGTTQNITWESNFEDNVSIELYKGGSTHRIITPGSTANDGSHPWTILFDEVGGSDFQIWIGSSINSAVSNTSDFFTITANQITITSPNGGETLYKDSTQIITWTENITGNIKIELFEEEGPSNDPFLLIANSIPSNGSYNWVVEPEVQPSTEYWIKITMLADPDIFDFSDTSFSFISELKVTAPNGGETWLTSTSNVITYVDNFSSRVRIELYKAGIFHSLIINEDSGTSFTWSIPDTLEPASDYKIRVSSVNDPTSFDLSDNDFSIVHGIINVTVPNGQEYWLIGRNYVITWEDNTGDNFSVELYRSGIFVGFIDNEVNITTENWNIRDTIQPGTDYRIKITSLSDNTVSDFSDSTFTIALPQIDVTDPNGGEEWRLGTTYAITWTDVISENVSIELYKADTSYYVISNTTSSDGTFNWKIPLEIEEGADYKLLVRSTSNLNVVDFSDNVFTILAVPEDFTLEQNFPNPFNPITTIRYGIPDDGAVLLEVFDITGQRIFKLVDEQKARGFYEVSFNSGVLPSGVYLYRIIAGEFVELKKMILTK